MSIQPLGFLDTSQMTALFVAKRDIRDQVREGILQLRELGDDLAAQDLPILKDWKSARALLSRLRASAAPHFGGRTPELGRAWIEVLPPLSGTPWTAEEGDYADTVRRTRTCLIPCPGAASHSGMASATLNVGYVHLVEHRALCSEVNFSEHTRVHLIVDVVIPEEPAE